MTRFKPLYSILCAGLLLACSETPTAPDSGYSHPQLGKVGGRVVERGTGVFTFEGQLYFSCAGEEVYTQTYAPYEYVIVQGLHGTEAYIERWITDQVTGTMRGLTSGYVWRRERNRSPFMILTTPRGSVTAYVFSGNWVSDNGGPPLRVFEWYFQKVDAAGKVIIERSDLRCS